MSGIFVSYSHRDAATLERLLVHLKPLVKTEKLDCFSDTDISPDEDWRAKIRSKIESCSIGILLVSADFLASDFVNDHELPELFKGRRDGEKTLLTVFVGPCNLRPFPEIADFQGFNNPASPLLSLEENKREEIFSQLSEHIGSEIEKSKGQKKQKKSAIEWESLDEMAYEHISDRRVFSKLKVSLPKLAAKLGHQNLAGLTFDECWVEGPSVICANALHISSSIFDLPQDCDANSLFLSPCTDWMVGVLGMSNLNIVGCRISNVGFIDAYGVREMLTASMEEQK